MARTKEVLAISGSIFLKSTSFIVKRFFSAEFPAQSDFFAKERKLFVLTSLATQPWSLPLGKKSTHSRPRHQERSSYFVSAVPGFVTVYVAVLPLCSSVHCHVFSSVTFHISECPLDQMSMTFPSM